MTRYVIGAMVLLLAACGSTDEAVTDAGIADLEVADESPAAETTAADAADGCADVVGATIEVDSTGYNFDVTVLSADTGWEKYADAWEVRGPDGEVLGERVLAHPHENEQPFTRSLSGVVIPDGIDEVTIAARDLVLGFCGSVVVLEVPRS